MMGKYTILKV